MSFQASDQGVSSAPGAGAAIEVRSSDSTDSDLIIVSIQESSSFPHSENALHRPPSDNDVKYRPASGASGSREPMEIATSGHTPDSLTPIAPAESATTPSVERHVTLDPLSTCETASCAAMSVDCERSSSGGSDSGGATRSTNIIMDSAEHADSSTNAEIDRASGGSYKNTVSGDSGTPIPLTNSSASSSPKLVVDVEGDAKGAEQQPTDNTQRPRPISESTFQPTSQQQPPRLHGPTCSTSSTLARPTSEPTHGGVKVNLIPAQHQPQLSACPPAAHVRFPIPSTSAGVNNLILTAALQAQQQVEQFAPGTILHPTHAVQILQSQHQHQQIEQFAQRTVPRPTHAVQKLQMQHSAALQLQAQQQQMLMAIRQQQPPVTVALSNRHIAPNLSQPRMVIKSSQPIPIAPKMATPAFRLSLSAPQGIMTQQTGGQIPVHVSTLPPAVQPTPTPATSAATSSSVTVPGLSQQMPPQHHIPAQQPTSSSSTKVVAQTPSSQTANNTVQRPPQKDAPKPTSSPAKSTRLIDSLAAKLQVHMLLLSSEGASSSTASNSSSSSFQCAICSASFSSAVQLQQHLERRSLLLRYNAPSQELVFYNKCALLYNLRRLKYNFNASKLTVSYYLPTSTTTEPDKKIPQITTEQPGPSAPMEVSPPATQPVEKKQKDEAAASSAPSKGPCICCPECENELPVTNPKKTSPALVLEEHFQRFEGDILVCRKCDVPVTNLCQAAAHSRMHRAPSSGTANRFVCPNCGQSSFDDLATLLVHIYSSCMAQMRFLGYRCLFCAFVSRDMATLLKHCATAHIAATHQQNGLKCPNCDARFEISDRESAVVAAAVLNHCLTAVDCTFRPLSIREICKHCGRIYPSGSTMRTHIERNHAAQVLKITKSSVPFYCALCRKNVAVTASVHVNEAHAVDNSANESYSWLDTFAVVDREYLLNIAAHAATKMCSICDNLISCEHEKMFEHVATHFDRICHLCLAIFDNATSLAEHQKHGDCTNPNKKKEKRRAKLTLKRKRRKSMTTISETEQLGSVSPLLYGYNCFKCKENNIFEDMDALEVHIRTVHSSVGDCLNNSLQEPIPSCSSAPPPGSSRIEETSAKRLSSSAFGTTPTKGTKKSRHSLDALTPFVCFACNHVAMSKGSLEAHERKCTRLLQIRGADTAEQPLGGPSSTLASSSSPIPQSGTSSASSNAPQNESSHPGDESSSNSGPYSSIVNESFCCSLCTAEFADKTQFISHMSRHIAS